MVNWNITATTIFCEAVGDEVTIFVYKDGTSRCAAERRYNKIGKEKALSVKVMSSKPKRRNKCDGENCSRVKQYRDLLSEEEKQAPK